MTEQASENINNWQSVSDISQESFEQDTASRNTSQLDSITSAAKLDDGFILAEGGSFSMGSPETENWRIDDEQLHDVTVASFYIDPSETKQTDYETLMGNDPSTFDGDDLPVDNISWLDAVKYANVRSDSAGLEPEYKISDGEVIWNRAANGYRLPTEAEWEYACFKSGECILRDDMSYILEKMQATDAIVISTPTYFMTMNGMLKNTIDRFLPKWKYLGGHEVYFIITGHDEKAGLSLVGEELTKIFLELGNEIAGIIYGEGVWQKGEVEGTKAMDEAYIAGKSI